jgi:arylsulfatase A-like enzyme
MPARNAVITGMYPSQNGICGNQVPPIPLSLRHDTFMHHLQDAGYYTSLIGKHHYIDSFGLEVHVESIQKDILDYGFDEATQVLDDYENAHNEDAYTDYLKERGLFDVFRKSYEHEPLPFEHPFSNEDDTAEGFIGSQGVDFIRNYDRAKPFYLNLSFIGPHPPFWHPDALSFDPSDVPPPVGVEDTNFVRVRRAHYMQKCHLIDEYVGKLTGVLAERGMLDDTVIIFTSDHGDCLGDFGIFDKRHFYEGSVKVPLIVAGDGVPCEERHNGARTIRRLISHLDLYPSILGFAGVTMTDCPVRAGRDFGDLLQDDSILWRDAVFSELATLAMIRTGNWKLVFDPEQGGVQQLFNLVSDPDELENLAGRPEYDSIVKALIERMLEERIRLTQFTHNKEEQRLQRVRI